MVLGRDGQIGAAQTTAGQAQALEGLGAGDLVDQVKVDVDQVGLAVLAWRTRWSVQTFSASVRGVALESCAVVRAPVVSDI